MSFFRSLVRRRRFAMWKWRASRSSMFTLLSSEARAAWRDSQSQRSGAGECRCGCIWATHGVQFSPGIVAGCKHGKGPFAFQFLPHSCHLRVPLCGCGVHGPQCTIQMINGSHWRGSRAGRREHQITVFCGWLNSSWWIDPCTCRASSHAFQFHVAWTAFIKHQTVKQRRKQKMNIFFGWQEKDINEPLLWGEEERVLGDRNLVDCCLAVVFSRSCLNEKPAITQWSKHDRWQIYLSQTSLNTAVNKKRRDAYKPPAKIFPLSSIWCKAVFFQADSSLHSQGNCGFTVFMLIEVLYIYKPSSVSCPTFLLCR